MTVTDFSATTVLPGKTPETVYNAINNVQGWWSKAFEGSADKVGDVFTVRFGATNMTMEVMALVPGKEVRWLVTDCYKHWLPDNPREWIGTELKWELRAVTDGVELVLTHVGLVQEMECYMNCEKGWNYFLKESVAPLVMTGVGKPN